MKRVRLPYGLATVTLAALAGAIALAGCATGSVEAEVIDDVFNVSGPTRVEASIDNGTIEVSSQRSQSNAIRVTATVRDRERVEYHAVREGDAVKIRARVEDGEGFPGGEDPRVDLLVSVPRQTDLDLEASNGAIRVIGISGQVRARTSNGEISVSDAVGDVEVETSNGRVDLADLNGQVTAETSNGDIEFTGTLRPGSKNSLKTSNGGVEVSLGDTAGVEIDAATSNGRVRTPLHVSLTGPARDDELVGIIGAVGTRLEVRASNGSINIR